VQLLIPLATWMQSADLLRQAPQFVSGRAVFNKPSLHELFERIPTVGPIAVFGLDRRHPYVIYSRVSSTCAFSR
jgi:hypothetical protein